MSVNLLITKREYVGLAGDEKPVSNTTDTIPAGSTFLETDTGILWTWLYAASGSAPDYGGAINGSWVKLESDQSSSELSPYQDRVLDYLKAMHSLLEQMVKFNDLQMME